MITDDLTTTTGPTQEFAISPEFQSLLSPLTADEKLDLRESIRRDGQFTPLIVWKRPPDSALILLDGHNRLEVCRELGIEPAVKIIDLPDDRAACNWVIDNQLGRRNVTPQMACYLRGRRYQAEKQEHGGDRRSSPQNADMKPKRTSEKLAEHFKVDKATIERDGQFAEAVDALPEEARAAVLSGESDATKKEVVATLKLVKPGEREEAAKRIATKRGGKLKPPKPKKKRQPTNAQIAVLNLAREIYDMTGRPALQISTMEIRYLAQQLLEAAAKICPLPGPEPASDLGTVTESIFEFMRAATVRLPTKDTGTIINVLRSIADELEENGGLG